MQRTCTRKGKRCGGEGATDVVARDAKNVGETYHCVESV